jgi:hypothetical protein
MKRFVFFSGLIFVSTMGIVVGFRISADAMAVIIGIICGVMASVPATVLLVWSQRQRDKQLEMRGGPIGMGHYPPVVVVNGQGQPGYGNNMPPMPMLTATNNGTREFKVIGQENTESNGDILPPFWDQL